MHGDHAVAPLAQVAELLAAYEDWPASTTWSVLAGNEVPVAAVVYHEDMYVEHALSVETAQRVGNLRCWETGELGHDGLRNDSRVLNQLLALVAEPR